MVTPQVKRALLMSIVIISLFTVFSITFSAGSPSQDLQTGIQQKDMELITRSVNGLVLQNDDKAYNSLYGALQSLESPPQPNIYMTILQGIGSLTNKDVLPKITSVILSNKTKDLGRDMLGAMKANRSVSVVHVLAPVLEKGTYEMQLECIHQLSWLNAKESLEALCNFLKTVKPEDKQLTKEVIGGLKNITGVDRGIYPEPWIQWWDENKNKEIGEIIKPKEIASGFDNVGSYRDMTGIEDVPKDRIIVVRNDWCDKGRFDGNYDKIQDILTRLGIEHTVVGKSVLDKDSYSLDDKWAVLFNCSFFKKHCCCPTCKQGAKSGARMVSCTGCDKHEEHESKLSEKTIKKIRQFVDTGGYLFTEDLNIEEIIMRAFPGYITSTGYLSAKDVKIIPAQGATLHPYLKFVFEAPPSAEASKPQDDQKSGDTLVFKPGELKLDSVWKIDEDSPNLKVMKKEAVTVLIVSPDLMTSKTKDEGPVAVTWGLSSQGFVTSGSGPGKTPAYAPGGKVLHVMSHFGHQKSKVDEFALQNLILNFLMEVNQRRPKVSAKR